MLDMRRDYKILEFKKKVGLATDLEIKKGDSGVYIIYSTSTDWCYVGEAGNLKTRFGQHINRLRAGKHTNHKLQEIYNEFSEEDLVYIPVFKCPSFMRKNVEYAYTYNFGLKTLNRGNASKKLDWRIVDRERMLMDKIPDKYRNIIKIHEKWKYKDCYNKHSEYLPMLIKNGIEIIEKGFKWMDEMESYNNIKIIEGYKYNRQYIDFEQISLDYIAIAILNDILGREKDEDVFWRGELNNKTDFDSDDLIYNIYKKMRKDDIFRNDIIAASTSFMSHKRQRYDCQLAKAQMYESSLSIENVFDLLYAYIIDMFIMEIKKNIEYR